MYFLDRVRGKNGAEIYRTKTGFTYPIQKFRDGRYKVKSGELIRVCMSSDFFLEEADPWRDDGWENVMLNVTCENQVRAEERIPLLKELPFKHKGIMCAPLIGAVRLEKYLGDGVIEQVICGGENYDGARPCHFDWVKDLHSACVGHNISFCFIETGSVFIKDGKRYCMPKKSLQSEMAYKSGMTFAGKPIEWKLTDRSGAAIPKEALYVPQYRRHCNHCGSRLICNGCSHCGRCKAP